MEWITWLAPVSLGLSLLAVVAAGWSVLRARALGLGLGPQDGPLPQRLETVGRRLAALEGAQAGLEETLGRVGLRPAALPYAPLGLGGARGCFVLALLNREGDGVVLNYLAGTAVRADLKAVRGWESAGTALTAEESQAVALARQSWAGQG